MIGRRAFLKSLAALAVGGFGFGAYGVGFEPMRLSVRRYRVDAPGWPAGTPLRIALVADLHACEPWMSAARIEDICARVNALEPDLTLLLGDYVGAHRWVTAHVPAKDWATALATLRAPLGVHAILGNHDWWQDPAAQARRAGPTVAGQALEAAGIRVYENDVARLSHRGVDFWLAGLGDQIAFRTGRGRRVMGVADLDGTLAKITDDAPVLLMAHEPGIFPQVPDRVSLTVAGHTHGGQVRILGWAPYTPWGSGDRYLYGQIVEPSARGRAYPPRRMVVSGGLGCSVLPLRIGATPEIVLADLGGG